MKKTRRAAALATLAMVSSLGVADAGSAPGLGVTITTAVVGHEARIHDDGRPRPRLFALHR